MNEQPNTIGRRGVLGALAGTALAAGMAPRQGALAHPGGTAPRKENTMIEIRRASERGHANHGWLKSHHTFSFANYYDPRFMGYRSLRVINEDRVVRGAGFPTHPHRDMEIISYVLDGALEHKDSMGTGSVIRPGEVQLMSAGRGVTHSEFNQSQTHGVHFLQIWITPAKRGGKPGYQQRAFPKEERSDGWRLLVSPDGERDSLSVKQDMRLYGALLAPGQQASHRLAADRGAWIQVARGTVKIGDHRLGTGDGAAIEDQDTIVVEGVEAAEVLLFDMA